MDAEEHRLSLEILKLLMQVAWADHELADDEVEHVLETAREAGFDDKAVEVFAERLRGESKLPPPDFGFLRKHKAVALAAAEKLVHADDEVHHREEEILEQIRELLDV